MSDNELVPPIVASAEDSGLILEVAAVGITPPATDGNVYVRCTDGTTQLLPEPLHDWAIHLIAAHNAHRQAGNPSLFPCHIEFGVLDGHIYAEML